MNFEKLRFIAVEGPIAAGKTSLSRLLANRLHANLLLEQPDENPFLARFYENPSRYALPTQLFFLFQRANQLGEIAQLDMFDRTTVSDFLLDKDPLFAQLNLDDDEFRLYQQMYAHLAVQAPAPDLVIYLQASPATLLERLKRRGTDYERNIPEGYLARLSEAYSRFFHQYEAAPLLTVNSENLNFVDQPEHLDLLLKRIEEMRGMREFFNRADD